MNGIDRRVLFSWLALSAATLAVILGLIALQGLAPGVALRELATGAFGSDRAWAGTLRNFVPLSLLGLGVTFAFRCGLWNIGAEGQFLCGTLAGAACGLATETWLLALIAGGLTGAAFAAVPASLRTRRDVPEILSTIMLNFVAIELLRYLVSGPLQEATGQFPQTATLPEGACLPGWRLGTASTTELHLGVVLAPALAALLAWTLSRTRFGLLMRATADSPRAVDGGGLPRRRTMWVSFVVSGGLAGLAGAVEVTGVTRVADLSLAGGLGYSAIAVALLAGLRPLLVLPSALLFAAVASGTASLQWAADLPGIDRFAALVQGLIVFAVLIGLRIHRRRRHG